MKRRQRCSRLERDYLVKYALGTVFEDPSIHVQKNRSLGRRTGLRALRELGEELLLKGGMGFVKLPNGAYFVGFNPTGIL
jgi:hypothetical protein